MCEFQMNILCLPSFNFACAFPKWNAICCWGAALLESNHWLSFLRVQAASIANNSCYELVLKEAWKTTYLSDVNKIMAKQRRMFKTNVSWNYKGISKAASGTAHGFDQRTQGKQKVSQGRTTLCEQRLCHAHVSWKEVELLKLQDPARKVWDLNTNI